MADSRSANEDFFIDMNIEKSLADNNADVFSSSVRARDCIHDSPLLHSGSRPIRLFEINRRFSMSPTLGNGLEIVCTYAAPG